jgi:hypothetical protein
MAQKLAAETHIAAIENGRVNEDFTQVSFELKTADGTSQPFWCAAGDIPKFAQWLLTLGQFAAEQSGGLKAPKTNTEINAKPTTAIAFGLAQGRTPQEIFVAVHIGIEQPVTFAATPNVLGQLQGLLNRTLIPDRAPRRDN